MHASNFLFYAEEKLKKKQSHFTMTALFVLMKRHDFLFYFEQSKQAVKHDLLCH